MVKNKKFIFICIAFIFLILICLNKEVFAINKEELLVTIESEIPLETELKKGDIITYKIILENKSTDKIFKFPLVYVEFPSGTEYINITTTGMLDVESTDSLVGCIAEKIEPNSRQVFEVDFKVKGTIGEIKFPIVMYIVFDEKFSSKQDCIELMDKISDSEPVTVEDAQNLFGSDAVIDMLEYEGKHTVLRNSNVDLGKGISTSASATLDKETDVITYRFTIKNDSEYKYLYPYIYFSIPNGTEFVDIYADKMLSSNDHLISANCMLEELLPYSEVYCELKVRVTGTQDKIKFPEVMYVLLNSEYTVNDLYNIISSTDFLYATNIEEWQSILGDVAYINEFSSEDVLILSDKNDNVYINSNKYRINETTISAIDINTNARDFMNNITNNTSNELKIYKGDKEILENENLATGMVLKIGDMSYTIIVNGDINGDSKLTVTDISLVKNHLVKNKELTGNSSKAADLNYDDKISVTDLSKLKMKIVGLDK